MGGAGSEYNVLLSYLELVAELPWGIFTEDAIDVHRVRNSSTVFRVHVVSLID